MKIFLIGFMASGKTTIGREVARRTGWAFVDLDERIERREGRSVSAIFAERGEEAFRRMERECLEEACRADHNIIVATGGGVPCFFDNMERMNRAGITVYLKFPPAALKLRIQLWQKRRGTAPLRHREPRPPRTVLHPGRLHPARHR